MKKLSVLTFSRNDIKSVLGLVKEVYEIADEIVLVDSSDRRERNELARAKRQLKLDKLRVFYAIPLGLVELYRPYGLAKCRNEWILYLDSDERLSENLRNDVEKIINTTKYDALTLKRFEYVERGKQNKLFTWNVRLYKKDKVLYKGIIHEQPIVKGKLGALVGEKYYMENRKEYHNFLTSYEYYRLLPIERMSYKNYNDVMVENFVKMTHPENTGKETSGTKVLRTLIIGYEKITMKKPEEELSNFDYFMYNFTKSFFIAVKKGDFRSLFTLLPDELKVIGNSMKRWKNAPDSKEVFDISQIIYKQGIISFLNLDKEKTIERLNRKYKDKMLRGADLLMYLLKERYKQINSLK